MYSQHCMMPSVAARQGKKAGSSFIPTTRTLSIFSTPCEHCPHTTTFWKQLSTSWTAETMTCEYYMYLELTMEWPTPYHKPISCELWSWCLTWKSSRLSPGPGPQMRMGHLLFNPLKEHWGGKIMMLNGHRTRQPVWAVWSKERLVHEQALALGNALDISTLSNYSSALNSYLNFVIMHDLPVDPTPQTLSFFTVYMCHHINPRLVNTYLSGISQQLETIFPAIKEAQNSILVHRTLQGCMWMRGTAMVRKWALTIDDVQRVVHHYHGFTRHDDLLFVSMLVTGFCGLLRLGELTFPDDTSLQNWKKVTQHNTVQITNSLYEFFLPSHKADCFFKGNKIIIPAQRFHL